MKRNILITLFVLLCTTISAQKLSVSVLGDSYSTFEGFITPSTNEMWYYAKAKEKRTDVTDVRQTWWWQYIHDNGYKLCVNNSWSGATISYTGYDGNDYSQRSFITRLPNLGDPDIIFIFGATNDDWAGTPMGDFQYDNFTYGDFYKFRPAMAYLLQQAQLRYPNVEIIVLINSDMKDSTASSIKTICDHYNVKYIQLKEIDKISGHPSVKGMKQIAEQIKIGLGK